MNDNLIQGNTIGERLRYARKLMRLTQSDAAYISGVPQSTISTYEADRSMPMAKQLAALCEIYQVSPAIILTGLLATSGQNDPPSPATTRLMNTVRGMEEKDIDTLADIAEVLKRHR